MIDETWETDIVTYDSLSEQLKEASNKTEKEVDLNSLLKIDKKVLAHAVTFGIIDMATDDYIRNPFVDFQHQCFISIVWDSIDAYSFKDINKTWQLAKKPEADANDEFYERLAENYSVG